MSIKVEQATTVQDTAASSATSTNAPKFSKFATKPGFVIPRNKLSGSLVPKISGGKKNTDVVNEESTKQVQRKSKWGPDLTQDASVRKGRALAYQTRVDQIAELLILGTLEARDNQDSLLTPTQSLDHESFSHQTNSEELKSMELERREAIGEIIKLNPSYKAPRDYKPLLKEAKVPIPIKEYPGYNFIGLIFGSAKDTQKRLEKETGAKIQVFGIKADTKEKGEITPSDGNEISGAYEELYVHVTADTYEKVDAAVALVELLVTPVSANTPAAPTTSASVPSDSLNVVHESQLTSPPPYNTTSSIGVNQTQPTMGSIQNPFPPYPGPWYPPQTLMSPPSSGFVRPPLLFGPPPPVMSAGFGSVVPQHHSVLQRPFMPPQGAPSFGGGHTGPPRSPISPTFHASPAQPYMSVPPPFTGNQLANPGPSSMVRPPLIPSRPPHLERPMNPVVGNNTIQWSQPQVPPHHQQPMVVPSSNSNNMFSPVVTFSSRPSVVPESPPFTSVVPQPHLGVSPPRPPVSSSSYLPVVPPIQSSGMAVHGRPNTPSQNHPGSVPIPTSSSSLPPPPPPTQSGNPSLFMGSASSSFSPMNMKVPPPAPVSALKPPPSGAGDFTFQPHHHHRPQNPAAAQAPPQNPSFRPAMHGSTSIAAPQPPPPPPVMQGGGFPRPPPQHLVNNNNNNNNNNNQMTMNHHHHHHHHQPQQNPQTFLPFPPHPPKPNSADSFSNHHHVQVPPIPHNIGGLRNFTPIPPQMGNFGGHFSPRPRPGNSMQQMQQTRPPNQQQQLSSRNPASSGIPQQIYDPFSPTSSSVPPPQQGGGNPTGAENDPEYEDLMASVGVK